jgi:hypothetical protein
VKRATDWDLTKGVAWHTKLEMSDKKYVSTYHMTYETFMYLVRKLEPFVKSRAIMFVKEPFEFRKVIGLVLYQLAYGVSANIIANRFNVGAFTWCKYVDIIVNVLISRDKLFNRYFL